MAVQDWSSTASSNTSVGGLSTDGAVQTVNNIDGMFRGMMADIRTGIDAGQFRSVGYSAKAGNYTGVVADRDKLIEFTVGAIFSLTAAATLGVGWSILIKASASVTVDPNGAELINGAATLSVPSGLSAWIVCTGTAFIAVLVASNDAASFTTGTLADARVSATLTADKAYRRGNVLGTVSQTAGVPTGALMEAGSNANGLYWRYADGLMIATGATGNIASVVAGNANSGFLSFPALFSASPRVTANVATTNPVRFSCAAEVSSGATFRIWLGDTGPGSSTNAQCVWHAIGTWF